jgi:hypothetical protein
MAAMQHLEWTSNGRLFQRTDGLGQAIPHRFFYKGLTGQKNVLKDGKFFPYIWDSAKRILQFGTCEIRLADTQVEFWQKDTKLLGTSIHPEIQEATIWNRKDSTVSGLRITEHLTERASDFITVAYDVATEDQKATIKIRVGGSNWARSAFTIEAKQAGKQRLTIAYDRKGTPIQDYDRGGKPLPIRRHNFGGGIWSWLPNEQDDHALEQLASISELRLKEADYQATEIKKVSFDSFGPSETSDDCLEIYDYGLYFDEYEGHIDCGNMDGSNRAHMGLIFGNVQATGTALDGCTITFPVETKGGSGCTANLGISNQDSPTPWSSGWLPSDCTLHGNVACNINTTGDFDSPEIKTLIQHRFDDVDWDAGDSMAFPLLDNGSPSGNYVYCTSEESGGGAELTIAFSTEGGAITKILTETLQLQEAKLRRLNSIRFFGETLALVEALVSRARAIRPLAETVNITETLLKKTWMAKLITETVSIAEGALRRARSTLIIAETVNFTEGILRRARSIRPLTETVNIIEGIIRRARSIRPFAETVSIAEGVIRRARSTRPLAETISLAEGLLKHARSVRVISETVNIVESWVNTILAAFVKIMAETLSFSEGMIRRAWSSRIISETISLVEGFMGRMRSVRVAAETVNLSEALSRVSKLVKAIAETITIAEGVLKKTWMVKFMAETISFAEGLIRGAWSVRIINETVNIVEGMISTALVIITTYGRAFILAAKDTQFVIKAKNTTFTVLRKIKEFILGG